MKSVMIPVLSLIIPPEAACVPELSDEANRALIESIRERGIEVPLLVWAEGDGFAVLSGRHRLWACQALRIEKAPCLVVPKPDDICAAMIEEAVVCRDLPRAGRAVLILDRYPELLGREGAHHTEIGMQNLKKPNVSPSVHSVNTREHPIATIAQASERYGIHPAYFTAVLDARAQCRPDSADWAQLRDLLCHQAMGPARILSALRGIQSAGANARTKVPGRAGADPSGIACRTAPSLETVFARWQEIDQPARDRFAACFRAALPALPDDLLESIADTAADWPVARCLSLARRLADRSGARIVGGTK